ncbi:hypothetical protein Glove_519g36 [Diversispora epigaea]|uniref:Uncharacterized protein n=1 Tax=Diversispora epigaea TaxID=1348612 RepID=A0A397GIS0_9GLOM|nr:hypothetical protein Glove_519g36 [Diversispora epigaea]
MSSSTDLTNNKVGEKILSETEVSVVPERAELKNQVSTTPKARPSISILPSNPEEKRKHVIQMALEKVTNLSLNYSTKNIDYFDCSTTCPICNEDHKKENIRNYVEGEWGSGEYCDEETYCLKCWGNKYQNSIQIVSIKVPISKEVIRSIWH